MQGENGQNVDLTFKQGSGMIVCGTSNSGKTSVVFDLLRNRQMFQEPDALSNCYYFYKERNRGGLFDEALKEGLVKQFFNYMPTSEDVRAIAARHEPTVGSIFVVDDFQNSVNLDTIDIFTTINHHYRAITIILCQSLFPVDNRFFRTISMNCPYILLKSCSRDLSFISPLAKQLYPGQNQFLVQAFEAATEEPYGQLLIDAHSMTPKHLKVRSHIFPHQQPTRVYVPAPGYNYSARRRR